MRYCKLKLIFIIAALLTGCATSQGYGAAQRHYNAGLAAEYRGDYAGARHHFALSLEQATAAGLPQNFISAATYNLGRMVGYTCEFEEADRLLQEALRLEESLRYPDQGMVTKRLAELARLAYDSGRINDSVRYYERAIPMLEQLGIAKVDPIGYAYFLDDFASSLEAAGDSADLVRDKAASLRASNPGKRPEFIALHYRDTCSDLRVPL